MFMRESTVFSGDCNMRYFVAWSTNNAKTTSYLYFSSRRGSLWACFYKWRPGNPFS